MDWTHFVKPGLDSFVKHGLDSFCKTWTGLICKTFYRTEFCIMTLVIFQTRKDQNKSKFKEKIQHHQFDLTFYGICTFCFIFQLSI